MDIAQYLKRAGDIDTAADLYAALVALQNVIGTGGASAGLRDPDFPGPIPNELFDAMTHLQPIQWRSYIASGTALGFPITSLIAPLSGTLYSVIYQADQPHVLVIGLNGRVTYRAEMPARTVPGAVLLAGDTWRRGQDIVTVCNYVTGTTLPTVGDPIGEEAWDDPADYTFYVLPSDE